MSENRQKSKIDRKPKAEGTDRRAVRSKRLIKQALMELMHSMPFECITVQDIIDQADVGRSTFYAHYRDRDDLVTRFFEEMMADLAHTTDADGGAAAAVFPLADLLRPLQDQAGARNLWTDNRGREFLFSVGLVYWTRRVEENLRAALPAGAVPRVPVPVAAQIVTGAAHSLIQWWLKNRMPYSPEEMQSMLDRMLQPGIRALTESE
jgi:AcrR family transcriptional regulator